MSLRSLVLFLALRAGVVALEHSESSDVCKDYGEAFDRVFTVSNEASYLNCSLVNQYVFDFLNTPYNITWYDLRSGHVVTEEEEGHVIKGTALLFLNSTMEHQGSYLCVVRTLENCYKQATVVIMDKAEVGECGRPRKGLQRLHEAVNGNLVCPLSEYARTADRFSIQWYKDCEILEESHKFIFMKDKSVLLVRNVSHDDAGFYTCRMTFELAGIKSEVAETIECEIIGQWLSRPQVTEPAKDDIKLALGSQLTKLCRVFVPGRSVEIYSAIPLWFVNGIYVPENTSDRIQQTHVNKQIVANGVWLERYLLVSKVLEEDFNKSFTCSSENHYGKSIGYFILHPADPDLRWPIGLLLTTMALLFIMGVLLYREFKVELVLAFRTLFPFFYESTDGDGKLYDAYVVYPRCQWDISSEAVEIFALKTLPEVLEERYGYRLFILTRDGLPGQAVADVVEHAMRHCRRLFLLYTVASLCCPEGAAWLEQQVGLHRALLDGSLTVVLLEMEELRDPSDLPESVRLLREKQGALQPWKRKEMNRWTCRWRRTEEVSEAGLALTSHSLSARFWREVRYNMPVRGKAKPHSRRKVLLAL
ncbi:interleukin-1 receptor type 1 [Brachyhypopomus gauderio]|uniref:interleukin-1 receptor type 1 n=1 Tax=Brachyhypopomus gauderio TaxID=698409 RepID=UPI0040428110